MNDLITQMSLYTTIFAPKGTIVMNMLEDATLIEIWNFNIQTKEINYASLNAKVSGSKLSEYFDRGVTETITVNKNGMIHSYVRTITFMDEEVYISECDPDNSEQPNTWCFTK